MTPAEPNSVNYGIEALLSLLYFILYFGYLFFNLENEFAHWISLVMLPTILLFLYHRKRGLVFRDTLASVGLERSRLSRGVFWAAVIGLLLSAAQVYFSARSAEMWALITTGKVLYLFPLAFLLLVFTAGFTEEYFFRGIVQTRLGIVLRRKLWAILLTSVLFGVYHLPYAYLHPQWPSHGDIGAALESSMGQGIIAGLILGAVYERSGGNLIASIIVHALIDTLPAMTLIKFNIG
jgi:membrane protease YdiL (CAAX protease family)